ncbi:unnamed protein product [Schistosoma mattheei]|uniref:Uncharacterized protein n=1 Tax=Schistosoma mattheei TaxID=31246 RepID=A0A183NYI4_9TREM|nr:unnamed protein product [Schistosoma mattheei]
MAEISCQAVAPARPNIWKGDMEAINSAASAENWEIDSRASVQMASTIFRQLYNWVTQPYIPWTVPKEKKHGHPWIGWDIRRLLRQKKRCWDVAIRLGTAGTMKRYRSDWVAPAHELMIGSEVVERVDHFTCVGSLISLRGPMCDEIAAQIQKAQLAFVNLHHLWRRRNIRLSTKGQVYCTAVCSVLLYGCDTWPVRVEDIRGLLVFDHRCLRSIARMFLDYRVSNAVVRKRVLAEANQPSFRETHFEFIKSHTKSDAIVTNGDSHLTESSIVEVTNPLQVEDEGFVEELIDYATNHHLVSYSFPTNTSNILSSGSTQHSIQSRPIYESRIISPTCPLNSTKDQMAALGLNHSVSNALKLQTNPIKCPVKEKTLRNVRLTNTEQHARSMSPSNLTDTYLSSKDTNDHIDEDDMEGTDLLHLISNSLDRFNAIVHPRDNISTLTSGLGESRNILSESESSNSYSQDCLFPTDIITKPTTILSADRECKFSNMMNMGNKLVQKHFNHSSLLILDSEVEQTDKLLEINNSSYTTTTTSSSFGRLPLSLSYSYSNEVREINKSINVCIFLAFSSLFIYFIFILDT